MSSVLEDLGIIGWDQIEPQILTVLYLQHPLLLIGNHGTCKSDSFELLAKAALGVNAKIATYDTPYLQFEDLIGFINPQTFNSGNEVKSTEAFVRTPFSIWDKDAILLDELTLANPFVQGKLNELVRKRTIMGIPTNVKLVFAAVNPPDSYDTMYMPLPLASRFAMVEVPSTKGMLQETLKKLLDFKTQPVMQPILKVLFDKADQVSVNVEESKITNLILDIVSKIKSGGHRVSLEGRTLRTMHDLLIAFFKLKGANPDLKFKTSLDLPEVLASVIPEGFSVVNGSINRATILAILKDAVANFDLNTYSLDLVEYIKAGESLDPLSFQHECLQKIRVESRPERLNEAMNLIQKTNLVPSIIASLLADLQTRHFLLVEGIQGNMSLQQLKTKIMGE
jgi:hypothetical protein